MKQDQVIANHERKNQGVASATPETPPSHREGDDRKGKEKKKIKSGKLAQSAGQGK